MAHIPDGVLSLPVIVGGSALALAGLAMGLRRLEDRDIAETGILAALFFVVSLVSIPLGPSSVHLLLGGPMGLILGWRAFPAVFVGLVLQAVLFGFGGLTTLGVDTLDMALPGVVFAALGRPFLDARTPTRSAAVGGLIAGLAVMGTAGGVTAALALSASDYLPSIRIILVTFLPLAVVEAVVTAAAVSFLMRVKPEMLRTAAGAAV